MIKRAAELLDVKENELKEFEQEDVFNDNILKGVICRRSDNRYGTLILFQINEEETEQIIYCTPKIKYPFDKNGDYRWPNGIDELRAWSKLDGTNICAYHYKYKEKDYVTYKTRLKPVVVDSKFGRFYSMWNELLDSQDWIVKLINSNPNYNLSFELYGSRNPITIKYDIPLATAFLFGVRRTDSVIKPPSEFNSPVDFLTPISFATLGENSTIKYKNLRYGFNLENMDDLKIEGAVFYGHITGDPSWRMWKCKSEQIEKIHWAFGGIPKNALWVTAINTFEDIDEPTIDDYKELLKEEFTETQIIKSINKVKKMFDKAKEHMELVVKVNQLWELAKNKGFDICQDKVETMRFLSKFFNKKDMSKVGTIVLKQAGLL